MVQMEDSYWAERADTALGGKDRGYGPWASCTSELGWLVGESRG